MGSDGIYGERLNQRDVSLDISYRYQLKRLNGQREVVSRRRGTRVKSSSISIGLDPRD